MTDALRAHGFRADVSDVSFGPIGTGQMADSFRIQLTYAGSRESDPAPPSSVVLKMHAEDPLSREAGRGGAYGSEVRFYTKLAPTLSVRAPACFYASLPDESHRFALLLDDPAPAEQGDQLEGCSVKQARAAVINLAGLHGPRW